MIASDEATPLKYVGKKIFVKVNIANKNKSNLAIKFTSQLASELFDLNLILCYIKL